MSLTNDQLATLAGISLWRPAGGEPLSARKLNEPRHALRRLGGVRGPRQVLRPLTDQVPIGRIVAWPFDESLIERGWLLLNGREYFRDDFPRLAFKIGFNFGSTSETFFLPDARGRVIAGLDNMGGTSLDEITDGQADILGGTLGVEEVTLTGQQSGIQEHGHDVNPDPHDHDVEVPCYDSVGTDAVIACGDSTANQGGPIQWTTKQTSLVVDQVVDTDAVEAHPNIQPTIFLNWIIKAG